MRLLPLAVTLLLLSSPHARADDRPTSAAAAPDHTPAHLAVAGGPVLGVAWISTMVAGVFAGCQAVPLANLDCDRPEWTSFRWAGVAPVVGPWIQLAVLPSEGDTWPAYLIATGLAQATGLGLLIAAVALGRERGTVDVQPVVTRHAVMLRAGGRF